MIVELLRHVELEARWGSKHDAAFRVHPVDALADFERFLYAEQAQRVSIGDEQYSARICHQCAP
jgi:hypothetical protein